MSDIRNTNKEKDTENKSPAVTKEQVLGVCKVVGKVTLRILSYIMNVLLTVMLVGTTCAIIVGTVFCIYLGNYIDPKIDSSLFVAASSDTTTRLYYMEYENEEEKKEAERAVVHLWNIGKVITSERGE